MAADKKSKIPTVTFQPTPENRAWLDKFKGRKFHGKQSNLCNRGLELVRRELEFLTGK